MMWPFSPAQIRYSPVGIVGATKEKISQSQRFNRLKISSSAALVILGFLVTAWSAFSVGRRSALYITKSPLDLATLEQTFIYNRTFAEAPSNLSNAAWDEIYPSHGTYFKQPQVAPQRSTLSGFHALHCLDSIRHGYWEMNSAALEGRQVLFEDIPMMYSPSHIRHCIDLLRQILMCNVDLTIEVKDEKVNGVLGFGVATHQCRDWEELREKINTWI